MLALVLLALSASVQAETPAEYVQRVQGKINFVQFIDVVKCGELRATVEVRSTGVTLGAKSGSLVYDNEVLQAATHAIDAESPRGIVFDVVYSTGVSCSSLMLYSE